MDVALLAAMAGGPDVFLEANRFVRLSQMGTAAEVITTHRLPFLSWDAAKDKDEEPPIDWQQLSAHAGKRTWGVPCGMTGSLPGTWRRCHPHGRGVT